jgi:uncharacterized protein YndB with AHSA1/START domain
LRFAGGDRAVWQLAPVARNKQSALRHPLIASAQYTSLLRPAILTALRRKTAMPNTVRLHRVLATKPDKVYRAFVEADALAKWLPPNGFTCTVHHLDAKVGGTHRMSFRNFTTGKSHSFGGKYLELVPGERLRYTDKFDDPNLLGEMQVTVTLKQVSVGTELTIVQEGIPDAIPVEACYLGWQDSLRNLASLVEPEINQ